MSCIYYQLERAKKIKANPIQLDSLFSDPDWIQTNDLLLRRQLLYSAELPDQNKNF